MDSSKSLSYKIFDRIEEIKLIEDFWKANQRYPYTDYGYFTQIVINEKSVIKPQIIVVYKNENPIFLLIGTILEKDYKLKIGYNSLFKLKVQILEIMYEGILGTQSPLVCRETVYYLKRYLAKERIDYIDFKQLNINSNMHKALKEFSGKLFISRPDLPNPHIYMDIPQSFRQYLETLDGKERRKIKSETNKFENLLKGKYEIKLYQDIKDLVTIMRDINLIHSKTYQYKLNAPMIYDNETRKKIQFELENKMLRVWIMYIEGKPVSFSTGLLYKDTLLGCKMGYLSEYGQYRPGAYLMTKVVCYLCENNIVSKLDFGFGDAFYKKRYCSSTNFESNVFIFSHNLRGLILNLMETFNRVTLLLYRKLQVQYEGIRRIKKISRIRLTRSVN